VALACNDPVKQRDVIRRDCPARVRPARG
jgi:hypothetical protein